MGAISVRVMCPLLIFTETDRKQSLSVFHIPFRIHESFDPEIRDKDYYEHTAQIIIMTEIIVSYQTKNKL